VRDVDFLTMKPSYFCVMSVTSASTPTASILPLVKFLQELGSATDALFVSSVHLPVLELDLPGRKTTPSVDRVHHNPLVQSVARIIRRAI